MMSRPMKGDDKLELSLLQTQFVNAYFDCDESPTKIAKVMGWKDRGRVSSMLKSEKVQIEIAKRKQQVQLFRACSDELNISKADKQKVLWEMALKGAEMGFDREGNQIMLNPQTSVAAIREMNLMAGDHAPAQQEVKVTKVERTEADLLAHIRALRAEFDSLVSIN